MSLLIKALDSAEKTKQAEKDKKQKAESATEPVLELAPLEPASAAPENPDLTHPPPQKPANSLSLEEEAGLSPTPAAAKKYAKAKPETLKPAATMDLQDLASVKPDHSDQKPARSSAFAASASRPSATESNQKAAAKVFVANQAVQAPSSKYALLVLGVAGALIIWLGLQGYTYLKPLFAPDAMTVKPAVTAAVPIDDAQLPAVAEAAVPAQTVPDETQVPDDMQTSVQQNALADNSGQANADVAIGTASQPVMPLNSGVRQPAESVLTENETLIAKSDVQRSVKTEPAENPAAERNALKVTHKQPLPAIDPALTSAYEAFTRGDDALAQQRYRQVLQKDVRNTDALLGMAAIAQRQDRQADAAGWFQKVLEIEPRNPIAQSAMINHQAIADPLSAESRLKSMLALQPEGANLHAALGNLYAEQNQWALAQEAYFNASRYAPNNADYAFNLAVSLDQLGKRDLALKQYLRALELININLASSPDRTQLETRIRALQ